MENKKPTQFLMKPKVDFCFKELMEDEEVRNAFLAAVLGINPVSYTHLDVYKRQVHRQSMTSFCPCRKI